MWGLQPPVLWVSQFRRFWKAVSQHGTKIKVWSLKPKCWHSPVGAERKKVSHAASQSNIINAASKSAGRKTLELNTAQKPQHHIAPDVPISNLIHFTCQDPLQKEFRLGLKHYGGVVCFRLWLKPTAAALKSHWVCELQPDKRREGWISALAAKHCSYFVRTGGHLMRLNEFELSEWNPKKST